MELQGKIISVLPRQEGTSKNGNPWAIQPYVMETLDQYQKKVAFEIFGDDKIKQNLCGIDEIVTISFDIESTEFGGKWYTKIRAWKVDHNDGPSAAFNAAQDPGLCF